MHFYLLLNSVCLLNQFSWSRIIWVGLNSNSIWLMWSTASEPGLRDCCQLFQVGKWFSGQLKIWWRQSPEVTFHFLSNARKSVSGPLSLLPKVKRIIRYLLQANDEIRPLCSNLWNLCERRQLLYVRAPDEYMGYWLFLVPAAFQL